MEDQTFFSFLVQMFYWLQNTRCTWSLKRNPWNHLQSELYLHSVCEQDPDFTRPWCGLKVKSSLNPLLDESLLNWSYLNVFIVILRGGCGAVVERWVSDLRIADSVPALSSHMPPARFGKPRSAHGHISMGGPHVNVTIRHPGLIPFMPEFIYSYLWEYSSIISSFKV